MKHCATLAGDPPGLGAFRLAHPGETNWAIFRQTEQQAYYELAEALEARQRGLCAYCEARLASDIPTPVRQVEHWRPKYNAGLPLPEITFGVANLHASCLGGAKPHLPPPYGTRGLAAGDHLSCGQKKGELDPEEIPVAQRPYRPTELPLTPPAFTVAVDGALSGNEDAIAAGLSGSRLSATVEFLGLNCERLQVTRARVREYLDEQLAQYEAEELDPDPVAAMRKALTRLATDLAVRTGDLLPPFVSLLRDYFGPVNEKCFLPDVDWAIG